MRSRLRWISLAFGVAAATAHAQDGRLFRADLVGYQEVPALSTPARGHIRLWIAPDESSVSYELHYAGLPTQVLQSHIHFGQMGVNGGISVFLCTNLGNGPAGTQACPQEGTVTGTFVAGDVIGPGAQGIAAGEYTELLAALRSGTTYANVHSSERTGGEIRGQITAVGLRPTP